jgi:hypothetical protein
MSMDEPPMIGLATAGFPEDELVLGTSAGGVARAYPVSVLAHSHIVNERLAERPLLITFCVRCFSAAAFDPTLDKSRLTFRVFGAYQGSFVMVDDQTQSLWAQPTGEALVGRLAGTQLEMRPIELALAGEWLRRYPEGLTPNPRRVGPLKPASPDELRLSQKWRRTLSRIDHRLAPNTLVLGVRGSGGARAYVLDDMSPGPRLLQDELAGVPMVLLASEGAWPLAYDRRTSSGTVDLRLLDDRIVDETGSIWSGEGRALQGPLAGTALRFLRSEICQWYAWAAHHPDSEIATPPRGK